MKLSIVVPCYNEGESINEFYNSLKTTLKDNKISYELMMIDDGSADDTLSYLKIISKGDKNVKIISFSRNFGKESAMIAGLKYVTGDYVAIMDADLQHEPEMLIKMYNKLLEDSTFDVVAAYKENRRDESALKRTLTSMFYRLNNHVADVKLLPGASDFRVFKVVVKDAIVSLPEKTRFLKGIFSWIGFNTIYVPYTPQKRVYGSSKWSILRLAKYSLGGIVSFSTLPLKLIFILGCLIFIVGILNFLLMGNLSSKTILLFISIIMLSIGIISLYVSRIYSNILGRPSYIIKETIGIND